MITDALRDCIRTANRSYEDVRNPCNDREILHIPEEELLAIADRIDAEHEADVSTACRLAAGLDDDALAKRGYIALPVDADGVPIHVGDVMDGTCPSGKHVNGTVNAIGDGVFWLSNVQFSLKPDYMHHHHAPTVEDVLREFAEKVIDSQIPSVHPTYEEAIAEFAARLRLAEEDK